MFMLNDFTEFIPRFKILIFNLAMIIMNVRSLFYVFSVIVSALIVIFIYCEIDTYLLSRYIYKIGL